MKHLILSALVLVAAPVLALARPAGRVRPTATVQVSAQVTLSRAPDRVYIEVGVRSEAQNSKSAVADNAARLATVIAAVRKAAGPGAQLTTANYSLAPQYQYHRDGKPPTLAGYTVTNLVRVRLDDLDRIGAVIDAANGAGANIQQNLRFALRDPETTRLRALTQAARRAQQRARALAAALGLRIVRIVSVREGSVALGARSPLIYQQAIRAQPVASPTPIESGGIPVTANVSLIVAVAPK